MQAIILAAGMGKRLGRLTQNNTKCMVKVNGVSLIERMLRQLDSLSLKRVVIVVGYKGQNLIDYIGTLDVKTPIEYIENPIYDKTNNIYSLSLAQKELQEDDTLLVESDIIVEDSVLRMLVDDPYDTLALVDKYESWMDGTVMKINEDGSIREFIPGKNFRFQDKDEYYKTVNIYKFSRHFSVSHYVPFLNAYTKALGENEYYEQVLRVISMLDYPVIRAKKLTGQAWYEIDDIQDLDIAESLFMPRTEEKLTALNKRYGGYWRYPHVLDFCYLVNPLFPTQRMMEEIKSNFEDLITQYPSGSYVNSLLGARAFDVLPEQIALGNGAAELIKSVTEGRKGKTGIIRPTFDEYPNRLDADDCVYFYADGPDFSYSADEIKEFFEDKDIDRIVLVNPDNPSGNYIRKDELLGLCEWAENKSIKMIIDESFCDFSDEEDPSLIRTDYLERFRNLIVIKSISKSYGVPGARLGVIASGDTELISSVKKDVAIWNINSFGEYFMQILEKYKKDYVKALGEFRNIRERFFNALSSVEGLRVIPSQANYFMCEITNGMGSKAVATKLLENSKCLIKDLSQKKGIKGNYIRLAIRDDRDNSVLVRNLNTVLNGGRSE